MGQPAPRSRPRGSPPGWFITNQAGEVLHNPGQTFQATLRISWDDPVPPQIGSAGADAESAFGLRDVMYAR